MIDIRDMARWWEGEDVVVLGCGASSLRMPRSYYASRWTITCNRSAAWGSPDFALCMEPPSDSDCWSAVLAGEATFLLSKTERKHPRTILISSNIRDWYDPRGVGGYLDVQMSPTWAVAAASVLGFSRIALIGVDLDRKEYLDQGYRAKYEAAWAELVYDTRELRQDLVNLSGSSRLMAVPIAEPSEVRTKR